MPVGSILGVSVKKKDDVGKFADYTLESEQNAPKTTSSKTADKV